MDPHLFDALIPIVAILATFGCPVALVFLFKWFKLRERELQFDSELRKDAGAALEARVQRLESLLLQIEPQLRPQGQIEGPPALRLGEEPSDLLPLRRADRDG